MAESKPRVLLVEDTRSLAVVYEQYLAQDGYEVQLTDWPAGLAQIAGKPAPVVLLDLSVADMSGMDILQQITERQLPCSVVVITVTARWMWRWRRCGSGPSISHQAVGWQAPAMP